MSVIPGVRRLRQEIALSSRQPGLHNKYQVSQSYILRAPPPTAQQKITIPICLGLTATVASHRTTCTVHKQINTNNKLPSRGFLKLIKLYPQIIFLPQTLSQVFISQPPSMPKDKPRWEEQEGGSFGQGEKQNQNDGWSLRRGQSKIQHD